jgi:hypothetical protein
MKAAKVSFGASLAGSTQILRQIENSRIINKICTLVILYTEL